MAAAHRRSIEYLDYPFGLAHSTRMSRQPPNEANPFSYENIHLLLENHNLIRSIPLPPFIARDPNEPRPPPSVEQEYDYVLKFLLVGDSDVGKEEFMDKLVPVEDDLDNSTIDYRTLDVAYKSTSVLLYGKNIKLHIWNTSGQGRFSTVYRSYSRGAQGIILMYDITNKWSFNGLDRWLQEIDEHAPGVPKILIGNRKHFEFRRQISEKCAEHYASKHSMAFLEVSALCNFNIIESCTELSKIVLERNGMKDFWTKHTVPTLQEMCFRTIVNRVNAFDIENLPLPHRLKSYLKSFSSTLESTSAFHNQLETLKKQKLKKKHHRSKRLSLNSILHSPKLNRLLSPFSSHKTKSNNNPSTSHDQCVIS